VVAEKPDKTSSSKKSEKRSIGFVQEPQREGERDNAGDDRISVENAETERKIMTYLVAHEGADLKEIAQEFGMPRSELQERLAFMEKQKWLRSTPDGNTLRFFPNPVRRNNQLRAPNRHKEIVENIKSFPGSTNREIGCRLLISSEDVAATTGSKANVNRLWTRTGTGAHDDPFHYYPITGEEMAEGQPS
jgi:hypothetical protein